MQTDGASREMPKYRCHKEVWALKIATVTPDMEKATLELGFTDPGFAPLTIKMDDLVGKPKVEPGMYRVQYEDGYVSFSPARAFEEGYMLTSMIPAEPGDLTGKIARAINIHSREIGSNTPDFLLASFLVHCLNTFDATVQAREDWHKG